MSRVSVSAGCSDDTAAELMPLIAHGLKVHGLSVRLPDRRDEYNLAIEMTGAVCELLIGDGGYTEWACRPKGSAGISPRALAGLAAFLLTGRAGATRGQGQEVRGMAFNDSVGQQARALGLAAELEVYADEEACDVTAQVVLTNPASGASGTVRVSEGGGIVWEHDAWPQESGGRISAETAGVIVTRIAPAVSLARDVFRPGSSQE